MGGDSIQEQLIIYSKGINMPYYSIQFALGNQIELPKATQNLSSTIRFLTSNNQGVIKSIDNIELARNQEYIKDIEVYCQVGDTVAFPVDSSGRIGFVISQAETIEKSTAACEHALKTLNIIVDDLNISE